MSFKSPVASTTDWGVAKVGTGLTVSNGVISTSGAPSTNYGFFYDTLVQTNPVANAVNLISWNTVGTSNQINILTPTQVQVANAGTYVKVFTISLVKTSGGAPTITSIWLRYNGVDVANSRQDIETPNQVSTLFVTGGYTLNMAAGSYIEMCWSSPDTAVQLQAAPAAVGPIRPAIPSAKITLTRVS